MVSNETNPSSPDALEIRTQLRCGDLGRIVELHGTVYEPLDGFGLRFEAFVGRTIAEFILDNDASGQIWLAERDGRLVGCTAIVLRENQRGQLRWVVVDPSERGRGLGKKLVNAAIDYCREKDCKKLFLETTNGLPESQTLYESLGFTVAANSVEPLWDGPRPLILMELDLA
jgi:GNAT superfamily N-acetyltransferase